jgi:hypothetical protein
VEIRAKFACIFAENRNRIYDMHVAQQSNSPTVRRVDWAATPYSGWFIAGVVTAGLSIVGVTVGMALFFTGIISLGVFISIIAVSAGFLAAAIIFFLMDHKAASEPHSDVPPQVNSQGQEPPPPKDEHSDVESHSIFYRLNLTHAVDLLPVKDWNFSLPADPVREERAQNIAEQLLAWGDPEGVRSSLNDYRYDRVGIIQIFLALKKLDIGFACEVFEANYGELDPLRCLAMLSSEDEAARNKAIDNWVKLHDCVEHTQIYDCVKSNPDLAQRMQDRMKDDRIFGLYLQVTATAAKDPSEAAKLIAPVNSRLLSDESEHVLECLPTSIAARIFMEMPFADVPKSKLESLTGCGSRLSDFLLCGMQPEEAANMLLSFKGHNPVSNPYTCGDRIDKFIYFMKLSPRATARVLAHMSEEAILEIFADHKCTCAVIDKIRPHLTEFNKELAERIFSASCNDVSVGENVNAAKLLAMDPQDVVSALKGHTDNWYTLSGMIMDSSPTQKKRIVQIVIALLHEGLLTYDELAKKVCGIHSSYCAYGSGFSLNMWSEAVWLRTLGEDLPDDMLVGMVRQMDVKQQQEFLKMLPSERKKMVQDIISAPETK